MPVQTTQTITSIPLSPAIRLFLEAARKEVGVQEVPIGSNAGPRVNQYLKVTGLPGGYYWCAAAVAFFGVEAAAAVSGDGFDQWPLPRTADCDVLLAKARKLGILHSTPEVGDLFLVMASPNDATHVGVVSGINADGTIQTIEGNSNDGGSSNGYKVAARPKRSLSRLQFVRWIDTVDIPSFPWRAVLVPSDGSAERPIATAFIQEGYAYIPVRHFLKMVNIKDASLTWNDEAQGLDLFGDLMPVHVARMGDGTCWGRVRQLTAYANLALDVDSKTRIIRVFRPK